MMTRKEFRQLAEKKIMILDGATGTELIRYGMPGGVCPEQWILEHPDVIQKIQRGYARAGADIIYAPTFGG
ncbi:MAG: homocysteine S-methyltransferase family protein, partial [Lentisphaeria bacterium]